MSELTCYAKRHEFDENGLGDFNVTMHSVSAYFKTHNINLSTQVRQQESQVYDAVSSATEQLKVGTEEIKHTIENLTV